MSLQRAKNLQKSVVGVFQGTTVEVYQSQGGGPGGGLGGGYRRFMIGDVIGDLI